MATYSSPIVAEVDGIRQYVAMTGDGAVGVGAKNGELLWRYKRAAYNEITAPTPIFHEDHVLISAWKGGPDLIKLTAANKKITATKVYGLNTLMNEHGGLVLVDGFVYGSHQERDWRCVEFKTGKVKWNGADLGFGSLTYADGKLYCLTQDGGEVALVEATPKEFTEISRFTLPQQSKLRKPSGKVWTHPVVANGCLYLRDQELLFCYKVK
jgi:outer membrane protein assembly factor BamB